MKHDTLRKIEEDIAGKDYGKARTRLHSLIASYPDDLDLRKMLGDVYLHLDYPEMAGRYWFLVEDKTPEMQAACDLFARTARNSEGILRRLKFKGDLNALDNPYATSVLLSLHNETGIRLPRHPTGADDAVTPHALKAGRLEHRVITYGCATIVGLILLFAVIGLVYSILYLIRQFGLNSV
jgi:hypothetical protein